VAYALYLGCTVPVRGLNYEAATRKVLDKLGVKVQDIGEFSCCGYPLKAVDQETCMLMAARNIALAEEKGLDLLTLCSACTGTLVEVNEHLKHDEELRARVNGKLAEVGKEIKGTAKVRHLARVLFEEVGVDAIKEKVVKDFSGIRLAAHYGCHYEKPSEIYERFDDPEHPQSMDKLVQAIGAEAAWYADKMLCCAGAVLGIDEGTSFRVARKKLENIREAGADAMVLICPFCDVMYEQNQKKISKQFEAEYNIPVLYLPQVLGLALGFTPEEMGIKQNRIKPEKIMERFAEAAAA
jgi:heterodisulfide reductase subunit B